MTLLKFFLSALLMFSYSAFASTAKNADPFGFELGVASLSEVKSTLGRSNFSEKGLNKFSNGSMLEVNASYFEIDEISSVVMIFDETDRLSGVIVEMQKNPTSMYKTLSKKYRTVSNRIDSFMNYGSAKLSKGNSLVYIDAPHLSFSMEVRYLTRKLDEQFQQTVQEEKKNKQNHKEKSF